MLERCTLLAISRHCELEVGGGEGRLKVEMVMVEVCRVELGTSRLRLLQMLSLDA